jgi:hypothetical protein
MILISFRRSFVAVNRTRSTAEPSHIAFFN